MSTSAFLLVSAPPVMAVALLWYRADYRRHGHTTAPGVAALLTSWMVLMCALGFAIPFFPSPARPLQYAGYGLMLLGLGLLFVPLRTFTFARMLGRRSDGLVTSGAYRYSRNPQYVAFFLFILGYAMTGHSVLAYAAVALWAVHAHLIVVVEEEHLERLYGAEYRRYKATAPRYLPGLVRGGGAREASEVGLATPTNSSRRPLLRRILRIGGPTLAALAVFLYGGAVYLVSGMGAHRVENLDATPRDYGLESTTVALTSSDGIPLQAWWMPAPRPRAVVVLIHGSDGIDASGLLGHARFLHDAGYAALALDMRAHGRSGGERIGFGFTEPRDIEAALDWLAGRPELAPVPVVLLGISMGGASCIRAAAARPDVDAVISLGAYSRFDVVFGEVTAKMLGVPGPVVAVFQPFARLGMATVYGVWPSRASALHDAPRLGDRPLLVGHGTADDQVPLHHAHRLVAAAPGAELWLVEGGGHILFQGDGTGPEDAHYRSRILTFLARITSADAAGPPVSDSATSSQPSPRAPSAAGPRVSDPATSSHPSPRPKRLGWVPYPLPSSGTRITRPGRPA